MRSRPFIAALAAIAALMVSCAPNVPDDPVDPDVPDTPVGPDVPDKPDEPFLYFALDGQKVDMPEYLAFNSGTIFRSYEIHTNAKSCKVAVSDSWCRAECSDQTSQFGYWNLNISTDNYSSPVMGDPREAVVTISVEGFSDVKLRLVQEAYHVFLGFYRGSILGGETIYLNSGGDTFNTVIETNCFHWTVESDASWLTYELTGKVIRIKSSPRTDSDLARRKGTLKLRSEVEPDKVFDTLKFEDSSPTVDSGDVEYGDNWNWD